MGMSAVPATQKYKWIEGLIRECRICPDCGSPVENVVLFEEETILYLPVGHPPGVEWTRGRHETLQPAKPLGEGEYCYYHRRKRENSERKRSREELRKRGVVGTRLQSIFTDPLGTGTGRPAYRRRGSSRV